MDENFIEIMTDFVRSSQALADAAKLCADDPIKQNMVMHVQEEFETVQARSEGIKLLVTKNYTDNRDFIIEELKQMIKSNHKIASDIRKALEGLDR